MNFDSNKRYGNLLICTDGCDKSMKTVRERLENEVDEFIPKAYRKYVEFIVHENIEPKYHDPLSRYNSIEWKYVPERRTA